MGPPESTLFSLQSKLIAAFVMVALAALVLAGSIFVVVRRGDQERQELDHVIAASPAIYTEFTFLQRRGDPETVLAQFVTLAAVEHETRILLLNRSTGVVSEDSDGGLSGERLVLPEDFSVQRQGPLRPYVSWRPDDGTPGSDLILVASLPSRLDQFRQIPVRGAEPYTLVLAVPESTITRAWLGLLPGLALATAIALPVAVVLGMLFAGYITRPLQQLTVASQRMAEGAFDVDVSVERRDEVGRLARAFSTMASRVGEAHTQMRMLLANVSHDLKTPLTSILGFGQALRDGRAVDEADVRRMGGVIHEEASRLASRLNDLLYLSELESGQTLLQREEVDLTRLAERVIQRIEPALGARDVRLSSDLGDGVTVQGDGAKLERALENLVDNAGKYTSPGGDIRVRTYREAGTPGHACFDVTNSAPDLTAEELPRLFERFYRRDRTRGGANQADGSGLGLPIARDLIELHGGKLAASLRDGKIVFTARLPASAAT